MQSKKILLSLALLVFCIGSFVVFSANSGVTKRMVAQQQQVASTLSFMNREVAKIKRDTKQYTKVSKDLDESAEGGVLEGYFDANVLKRMKATYFGETGKASDEYFFVNPDLMLVVSRISSYDTSISDSPYDAVQTQYFTRKYYFDSGKIIRMIPSSSQQFSESPESLLEESRKLEKKLLMLYNQKV